MPGDDTNPPTGGKTYSQDELQAAIEEAKKGLLANRDEALNEAKALKRKLANFEGIDPDKYKELLTASERREREEQEKAGNWKALEAQLIEKHGKEKQDLTQRAQVLTAALERHLIDAAASAAIAEAKGSVRGLLPHVKPHVRVVEQDGEFLAQVVDAKGNPRISDAKGNPMSISDLVAELKQDQELGRLFEGTGSSGGGAPKSNPGGTGSPKRITNDPASLLANLDALAKGQVTVDADFSIA